MTDFASRTPDTIDAYPLGAFLDGGMEPEKALALTEWLGQRRPNAEERLAVVARIADSGVDYYTAFALLFCHPSDHERYLAIGTAFLNSRKETALADDPEQI